ncbi:MAG: hypothetical protein AAF479_10605 [Pseudomonadota bacterium]
MADGAPPIGHNSGEAADPFKERVNEFGRAAVEWGKVEIDDSNAEQLNDFIEGARALRKEVDAARVVAKKPYDDASKNVQSVFKPLIEAVDKAGKIAKGLQTSYLRRKEEEQERQREAEMQLAAEAEAAAQAEAKEAEESGDFVAAAEAEAKVEKTAKKLDEVQKPVKAQVKSASGAGRTASMRTFRKAKITSVPLALAYYRDHPKVADLILELADADIRRAGKEPITIPGIEIVEERRIA